MVMPQFMNIVQRRSPEQCSEAAEQAISPGTGAPSVPTSKDLLSVGRGMECSIWQLLTAHENGQCLLWDISDPMTFQPIAKFAVPSHPARCGPLLLVFGFQEARCCLVCSPLGLAESPLKPAVFCLVS